MLHLAFIYHQVIYITSKCFIGLTRLNMSSFTGWKRYESGMDSKRPAVIAAQKILAR